MSVRTKKTFVWLWVAALLTATMGISVQQIYCYCAGKTSISIFVIQDGDSCAAAKTDSGSCCPVPEKVHSCCEKGPYAPGKSHECNHKSTRVFQMKPEFVVENPFENSFDGPLWMSEVPMFRHFVRPVLCTTEPVPLAPPPLSGRDICLRHQVSLC